MVRNYKECILRHNQDTGLKRRQPPVGTDSSGEWGAGVDYVAVLRLYEAWPSRKALIYYEDLLVNPRVALAQCLDFLGLPEDSNVDELVNHLAEHKQRSLNIYGSGQSRGQLRFHSERLTKEERVQWDEYLSQSGSSEMSGVWVMVGM